MNASEGNNNPSERKKGKGRQKLAMEKIENETNLQVTFSKRRAGVFKKISEINILCGAEAAAIVFSPGDKAHSFGHPDVETIANRFLNTNNNAPAPRNITNEATILQRSQELINIEAQLEQERQRKRELQNMRNQFPPCLDDLNYQQLDQLKRSIMGFKHDFDTKMKNVTSRENSYIQDSNPEAETTPSIGNDNLPLYNYGSIGNPMPSSSTSSFAYTNVDNYGFMSLYPHMGGASGSDVLIPYNYGTTTSNVETQANVQNKFQGFNMNYDRKDL